MKKEGLVVGGRPSVMTKEGKGYKVKEKIKESRDSKRLSFNSNQQL